MKLFAYYDPTTDEIVGALPGTYAYAHEERHRWQYKKGIADKVDMMHIFLYYTSFYKTTKTKQDMAYLDPTFDLSRVCFTLEQVAELVDKLPPGSAILYDESWKDVSTGGGNGENQRKLIRIMTEKRKKRFYWGIVSATFFDLKKYFVIHRTRALINVYANGLERGFFSFYDRDRKKTLYIKGRKDWDMTVSTPNFRGRFSGWVPWDAEAYDKKKDESTKATEDEEDGDFTSNKEVMRYVGKRIVAYNDMLKRNQFFKTRVPLDDTMASFLGISTRTLRLYRTENELTTPVVPGEKKHDVVDWLPERGRNNDNFVKDSRELDEVEE